MWVMPHLFYTFHGLPKAVDQNGLPFFRLNSSIEAKTVVSVLAWSEMAAVPIHCWVLLEHNHMDGRWESTMRVLPHLSIHFVGLQKLFDTMDGLSSASSLYSNPSTVVSDCAWSEMTIQCLVLLERNVMGRRCESDMRVLLHHLHKSCDPQLMVLLPPKNTQPKVHIKSGLSFGLIWNGHPLLGASQAQWHGCQKRELHRESVTTSFSYWPWF